MQPPVWGTPPNSGSSKFSIKTLLFRLLELNICPFVLYASQPCKKAATKAMAHASDGTQKLYCKYFHASLCKKRILPFHDNVRLWLHYVETPFSLINNNLQHCNHYRGFAISRNLIAKRRIRNPAKAPVPAPKQSA